MPEYLAPGVYVEETSFRAKPLEGVSTSTTAFVGATRTGPIGETPELVTSVGEFERVYGGTADLSFDTPRTNYLAHSVRAFFDNGGSRLYVSRVYTPPESGDGLAASDFLVGDGDDADRARFVARYPGSGADGAIELLEITTPAAAPSMARTPEGTLLRILPTPAEAQGGTLPLTVVDGAGFTVAINGAAPVAITIAAADVQSLSNVRAAELNVLFRAEALELTASEVGGRLLLRTNARGDDVTLVLAAPGVGTSALGGLGLTAATSEGDGPDYYLKVGDAWEDSAGDPLDMARVTPNGAEFVSLNLVTVDADGSTKNFEDLAYGSEHPRFIGSVLSPTPPRRSDQLENRYALELTGSVTAFELREGLLAAPHPILVSGGSDGQEPTAGAHADALLELQTLEDISIVAAPGSSALTDYQGILVALLTHVERRRAYQIAVLDTPPGLSIGEARETRSTIDSRHAALYYPWVRISNPDVVPSDVSTPRELDIPPSGFICGIYARNDAERGVHKAPANEIVRGALRFEAQVNMAQQEVLNPAGVNVLRSFPGRGHRVWGARLAASDPEWKYVNLRRYFNYVEASIDRGTQWVVFEPNGPRLWARVRTTVSDFLYTEWRNGALLGTTPAEGFFVRCDRSTMTQSDLDNGRLIVEVGIAVVRPAEFVIFRVGQKTADVRS
jgi:hypothetical protein